MPETFRLLSPDGDYSAEIRPDLGGLLTSLRYRHMELIDCDLTQSHWADGYPSAVLYPFPNRTERGVYSFSGKTYQLPQNEVNRQHALHGLVWNQPFQVLNAQEQTLTCRYAYSGQESGYPFPFCLDLTFDLQNNGLHVSYVLENTSTATVPAAWGWHPYFTLGESVVDECELILPDTLEIPLGDHMIPIETQACVQKPAGTYALRGQQLDQVYQFQHSGPHRVQLRHEKGQICCIFSEEHAFLTLYTPPSRKSIAIEPQTANINAFNNHQGLWLLSPGAQKTGTIHIQCEESSTLGEDSEI